MSTGRRIALVLVLALSLRLVAGTWWQSRLPREQFGFGDSESYWELAHDIARGWPYEYPNWPKSGAQQYLVFRAPGYPLLLAALFQVVGTDPTVMWARAFSALLATLGVGGVMWLAKQLFDTRTACLAGLLAALYPGAVMLGALVLSEAPFCALVPLQLGLWHKAWRAGSAQLVLGWSIAAGLAAGGATLVRPSWLLFTPLAIVLGIAFWPARLRHAWVGLGLMLGLCAAMAPWWIRNARVTRHFVPTTLQVGASLYDGLNPQATGASDMDFVRKFESRLLSDDFHHPANAAGGSFEFRLDRQMRDAALDWAMANPAAVLRLAGVKLLRLWNIWPNEPQFRRPLVCLVVAATYVPLLVLAILGTWRFARRGWPYVLCVLPAVYLTLLHTIFVSSIRYREPAMLILIVLAAGWITDRYGRTPSAAADS